MLKDFSRRFRRAAICSLLLAWAAALAQAQSLDLNSLPKPTGYVNDFARVVTADQKDQIEEFCTRVERELGVQFALVTVGTVGDKPIRDFALELSRKWGVGSAKGNQGVLLLLAVNDRKSDIETGRGIEPYITDGFAGGTLRSMRPALRAGNYGAALSDAARAMAAQIAQGKGIAFSAGPEPREQDQPQRTFETHRTGLPGWLIILGILFFLWLFGRGGRRGGGGGSFLTGMLLGNLLGGRSRYGGGDWGGGGFGGGSGGGGGFGGFGGGDFGGGGASSDW